MRWRLFVLVAFLSIVGVQVAHTRGSTQQPSCEVACEVNPLTAPVSCDCAALGGEAVEPAPVDPVPQTQPVPPVAPEPAAGGAAAGGVGGGGAAGANASSDPDAAWGYTLTGGAEAAASGETLLLSVGVSPARPGGTVSFRSVSRSGSAGVEMCARCSCGTNSIAADRIARGILTCGR